jgi:DNA repair photolyase
VQAIAKRFNNQAMMGPLRFDEKQLEVDYGKEKYKGKTIFIEHTHDLFHPAVNTLHIVDVMHNVVRGLQTNFVIQTRNTLRAYSLARDGYVPKNIIFGTTIETNREVGNAPAAWKRARGLKELNAMGYRTFVTIEPILEFDLTQLFAAIAFAGPNFVNIGADSKGTGLEEPSREKVLALIDGIRGLGIEIRTKRNLERLIGGQK